MKTAISIKMKEQQKSIKGVSKYHLVKETILEKIRREELKPGQQLPAETSLATQFNVARMTLRQAIGELVQEGVLERVHGNGTFVTDDGLEHLKQMKQLETLGLSAPGVTDRGLEVVSELSGITSLYLRGTQVSDAGLQHLRRLTRLYILDLSETDVSDRGLQHLAENKNLGNLFLRGAAVGDLGLAHLKPLKKLWWLELGHTAVTGAGLEHLKEFPTFGLSV